MKCVNILGNQINRQGVVPDDSEKRLIVISPYNIYLNSKPY